MRFYALPACLLLAIGILHAQGWQTTLPSNAYPTPPRLTPSSEGGWFTAGVLKTASETDIFTAKINETGELLWHTQVEKPGDQNLKNLSPTATGFNLIGTDSGYLFYQLIDEYGLPGTYEPINYLIGDVASHEEASNGDILSASYASYASYAERRTHDGTPIWWKMIDNGVWGATIYHNDACLFLHEMANGNLLTGGHKLFGTVSPTGQISNTYIQSHLTLLSAQGDILYRRFYENSEDVTGAWEMPDGHMAALTRSSNPYLAAGFFRVKYLDVSGMLVWEKYFEGKYRATKILAHPDGNFTVVGYEQLDKGFGLQNFIFLKKLDTAGNEIWHRTLPFPVKSFDQGALADANGYTLAAITDEAVPRLTVLHLDAEGLLFSNIAQGKLFHDFDSNCAVDSADAALPGWEINFYKNGLTDTIRIATDGLGNYVAQLDTGTYEIKVKTPDEFWTSCQNSLTISNLNDTLTLDFLVKDTCPVPIFHPVVYTACGEGQAEIDLQVSGGLSTDYQFQWSGPTGVNSTDSLLTGLSNGVYQVTVQDGNCFHTDSVAVDVHRTMVTQWQQAWGGSQTDFPTQMSLTPDGGCLVTGRSNSEDGLVSDNQGADDAWLLRYDADGHLLWQKGLGSSFLDEGNACGMDGLGNAWLAGKVTAGDHDFAGWTTQGADVFLAKMDGQGNLQNLDVLQGSNFEAAGPMAMLNEGGLLIVNSQSSSGDFLTNYGAYDAWAYRFDGSGNEVWKKNLVNPSLTNAFAEEVISDVAPLQDGGFILCGYRDLNGSQNQELWMLRTDADGGTIWEKTLGGTKDDGGKSCLVLPDGNFLWSGYTYSNDGDVGPNSLYYTTWLIKTNPDGDIIWKKVLPFAGQLIKTQSSTDNNLWFFNSAGDFPGHTVINRLDSVGDFAEQIEIEQLNYVREIKAVPNTSDFLFLASSEQTYQNNLLNQHGGYDFWVGKLGNPLPSINALGADTIACPGTEVLQSVQVAICGNCSYLWDDGSNGSQRSIQADSNLLTHVIVTLPDGCQAVDLQLITKNILKGEMTVVGANCGENNGSANAWSLFFRAGADTMLYAWSSGEVQPYIINKAAGNYTLTISNGACTVEKTVTIPLTEAFREVEWQVFEENLHYAKQMFELPDSSIAVHLWPSQQPDPDYVVTSSLLRKYSPSGNLTQEFQLPGEDYAVLPLPGGGFMVAGTVGFNNETKDFRLKRLDANGNTVWQKTYPAPGLQQFSSFCQSSDGGFMLVGWTTEAGDAVPAHYGGYDAWLLKTDATGEVVWSKVYGGSCRDWFSEIVPAPQGGYFLGGGTCSTDGILNENQQPGQWLFKIDEAGTPIWSRTFGEFYYYSTPPRLAPLKTFSDGSCTYGKYRFDAGGNPVWEKSLGQDFVELPNGELIGVQTLYGGGGGGGGGVVWRTGTLTGYSNEGDTLWQNFNDQYSSNRDFGNTILRLSDGGYLVGGHQHIGSWGGPVNPPPYDAWWLRKYEAPTQLPQNQLPDTVLACLEAPYLLESGNPSLPHQWSTGSTSEQIWVTQPGSYAVEVGENCSQVFNFQVVDAGPGCLQHISQTIVLCEGDTWQGHEEENGETEVDTIFGPGSIQVTTTSFEVLSESSTYLSNTICSSDTFFVGQSGYNLPGEYLTLLTTASGCDSLVYLNLSVIPSLYGQFSDTICMNDSIVVGGTVFNIDHYWGYAYFPAIAPNGCDSVVEVHLSFLPSPQKSDFLELTPGTLFLGVPVYTDTVITEYRPAPSGCDSIIYHYIMMVSGTKDVVAGGINFNIFPNPTSGEFFIEMDLPEAMEMSIEAVDMLGRQVAVISDNAVLQQGKQQVRLDARDWPSGVYLLELRTGSQSFFEKIIRQ